MPGLRERAEKDLSFILEDPVHGFGWPITITDPGGTSKGLTGFSSDISQIIDPDTGQIVSGRLATCTIRMSSLLPEIVTLPEGISDAAVKPWLVKFDDINGKEFKFKVAQSNPDRELGVLFLILELWVALP